MIEPADKKREMILEKALLRFAHFGINKTTMNEIADDLAISKPSLYYYFPDKISLVLAVAERIFNEFFDRVEGIIADSASVKDTLFAIIELRREFIQKYFMLHIGDNPTESLQNNEDFKALIDNSRVRENALIKSLFERDFSARGLQAFSAEKTAELYRDTIIGLGMCVMGKHGRKLLPEAKGYEEVIDKQKAFTEIFLRGLEIKS